MLSSKIASKNHWQMTFENLALQNFPLTVFYSLGEVWASGGAHMNINSVETKSGVESCRVTNLTLFFRQLFTFEYKLSDSNMIY